MNSEAVRNEMQSLAMRMQEIVSLLTSARQEEATKRYATDLAKLEMTKAQDALTNLHRERTISITSKPEWEQRRTDPRTNELSAEWGQLVIDHDLQNDTSFTMKLGEYYKVQQSAIESQRELNTASARVAVLADELGAIKNRGLQLAAVLQYASAVGKLGL